MKETILIPYDYWINSQLSIARHYGGIKINGKQYIIMGQTLDLVRNDWAGVYNRLGRGKLLELLEKGTTLKEAKEFIKNEKARQEKSEVKGSNYLI